MSVRCCQALCLIIFEGHTPMMLLQFVRCGGVKSLTIVLLYHHIVLTIAND